MSMPSSSELVATSAGSLPAFSASSISSRCSRAIEPWWARQLDGGRSRLGQLVEPRRQPLGQAAGVDEDQRRAVLRGSARAARGWIAGQIELRTSGSPAAAPRMTSSSSVLDRPCRARPCPRPARRSARSSGLRTPASTIVTGRGSPSRSSCAAEEAGHLVERALRRRQADALDGGLPAHSRSRRSSDSARWAPRLVPATAWISSTITCSTDAQDLARLRREHQVQRLGRGDQDVGRVAGDVAPVGLRACRRCAWPRAPAGTAAARARPPARCRRAAPAGCARRRRPAP